MEKEVANRTENYVNDFTLLYRLFKERLISAMVKVIIHIKLFRPVLVSETWRLTAGLRN